MQLKQYIFTVEFCAQCPDLEEGICIATDKPIPNIYVIDEDCPLDNY